jgi:hypothetical protein
MQQETGLSGQDLFELIVQAFPEERINARAVAYVLSEQTKKHHPALLSVVSVTDTLATASAPTADPAIMAVTESGEAGDVPEGCAVGASCLLWSQERRASPTGSPAGMLSTHCRASCSVTFLPSLWQYACRTRVGSA